MKDYERCFEDFWKPIITNHSGKILEDRLKRELYDYYLLCQKARKVYNTITGGLIDRVDYEDDYILQLYYYQIYKIERQIKEDLAHDLSMQFLQDPKKGEEKYVLGCNHTLRNVINYLTEENHGKR